MRKNNRTETQIQIYASHGSARGEINLQWDAVKSAKQYIVQVSNTGRENWKHVDIISGEQYTLNGLISGKIYSFRIAPIFISGQGEWCKPAEKKVK